MSWDLAARTPAPPTPRQCPQPSCSGCPGCRKVGVGTLSRNLGKPQRAGAGKCFLYVRFQKPGVAWPHPDCLGKVCPPEDWPDPGKPDPAPPGSLEALPSTASRLPTQGAWTPHAGSHHRKGTCTNTQHARTDSGAEQGQGLSTVSHCDLRLHVFLGPQDHSREG